MIRRPGFVWKIHFCSSKNLMPMIPFFLSETERWAMMGQDIHTFAWIEACKWGSSGCPDAHPEAGTFEPAA